MEFYSTDETCYQAVLRGHKHNNFVVNKISPGGPFQEILEPEPLEYGQVYTLMSSPEGLGFDEEGFALLTFQGSFENWDITGVKFALDQEQEM